MLIIPVLDIRNGLVVRAAMGDRARYRPIETPLSPSADPIPVAAGLAGLVDFPAFYIADLDAIEGRGDASAACAELIGAFPRREFWIDAGARTREDARQLLEQDGVTVVLGSESLDRAETVWALKDEPRIVLSLDFRGEAFLGPSVLLERSDLWPARVIVMTLAKVGSGAGPDMERLADIKAQAGERQVFAAGGVRGPDDLDALAAAGIAGALVSTALHDGRLDRAALGRFMASAT